MLSVVAGSLVLILIDLLVVLEVNNAFDMNVQLNVVKLLVANFNKVEVEESTKRITCNLTCWKLRNKLLFLRNDYDFIL